MTGLSIRVELAREMDSYTAFAGHRRLAQGPAGPVAAAAAAAMAQGSSHVLVFEDSTGDQVELDLRRPTPAIALRTDRPPAQRPGRGRPRLGVVAREVTLLPRHWDWLAGQPGGASAALRRLVEDAARASPGADAARKGRDAAYKVMTALAGDLPGYEAAARALFRSDLPEFSAIVRPWPQDVRAYVAGLAQAAA